MDFWSVATRLMIRGCFLLYPTTQAWDRISTSNISYCIPKCTETSPRTLGFAGQEDSSVLVSPAVGAQSTPGAIWMRGSFFSLFTEVQASFKADFPWSSGRWMGPQESCCRNAEMLHNAAWFHAIPFGLWAPPHLPPAVHYKSIVTAHLKLNSLPKLFLGKRAAQEEGLQKSKKQNSPWDKVMSLWQGTVVWGALDIFWMDA